MEYESFAPLFGRWAPLFREFIEGEEMDKIYDTLKREGSEKEIVPDCDSTFRAFQSTNPDSVVNIWYLMDPYPKKYRNGAYQATGIAMDCSNSPDGRLQPSLEKWYEGVEDHLGRKVERNKSLRYLSEQGVMMLNTGLTCRLGETGSHCSLWEPFHKYFLEEVMKGRDIIYVMCGESSQDLMKYITGSYMYSLEHPVAASYASRKWQHKNIFATIDKEMEKRGKDKIFWNVKEYREASIDVCPF